MNHKFLVGDAPTYVDFYFFELINWMVFLTDSKLFTDFPKLGQYHVDMSSLPGLKEYLDNADCMEKKRTFNNKAAKINNTV